MLSRIPPTKTILEYNRRCFWRNLELHQSSSFTACPLFTSNSHQKSPKIVIDTAAAAATIHFAHFLTNNRCLGLPNQLFKNKRSVPFNQHQPIMSITNNSKQSSEDMNPQDEDEHREPEHVNDNHDVVQAYKHFNDDFTNFCQDNKIDKQQIELVAISKTKPIKMIQQLYDKCNHTSFGENYVSEIVEKSPQLTNEIKWHFVGHLQTNKVKHLLKIPNLYMIESVDSIKLANEIEKFLSKNETIRSKSDLLRILVQVNTSGEPNKSGCSPEESYSVYKHIIDNCPHVQCVGLMTIGALDSNNRSAVECFKTLQECRNEICSKLNLSHDTFQMSMGMSGDYQEGLKSKATIIRIGSTIFGARDYNK